MAGRAITPTEREGFTIDIKAVEGKFTSSIAAEGVTPFSFNNRIVASRFNLGFGGEKDDPRIHRDDNTTTAIAANIGITKLVNTIENCP